MGVLTCADADSQGRISAQMLMEDRCAKPFGTRRLRSFRFVGKAALRPPRPPPESWAPAYNDEGPKLSMFYMMNIGAIISHAKYFGLEIISEGHNILRD